MTRVSILAPTLLEYVAASCVLPRETVSWCGVGLSRRRRWKRDRLYIFCGLAGALAPGVRPGTLLVPERVGLADGQVFDCDRAAVDALRTALAHQGSAVDSRPLLTADRIIVGAVRNAWASRGFAGVDMETGKLAKLGARVATVRAVLDGPEHELSADWQQPLRALRQSETWKELLWLARVAPPYSWSAAHALKAGLSILLADRYQ